MDGVFSFLKPPGITSHDAVSICRRVLRERRIGHSGTLDPLAYGVLPIFIGKATRIIEYMDALEKTYVAECKLGFGTDTEDSTGQMLGEPIVVDRIPTMADLEAMAEQFKGEQQQKPSIYSAIKINGQKAYELARQGKEVDLPSRTIYIYDCQVLAYSFPYFTIKVTCSAGTYIRALLRDMCAHLGIPGHMTQLARTAVGSFHINDSVSVEELEARGAELLEPVDRALLHLQKITLPQEAVTALKQGRTWPLEPSAKVLLPPLDSSEMPAGTGSLSGLRTLAGTATLAGPMTSIGNKGLKSSSPRLVRAYGPDGFFGVLFHKKTHYKVAKNIF